MESEREKGLRVFKSHDQQGNAEICCSYSIQWLFWEYLPAIFIKSILNTILSQNIFLFVTLKAKNCQLSVNKHLYKIKTEN